MANAPDLIYCAGGNERMTQIAHDEGFLLGVRSDKWHHPNYTISFVDVDYKTPRWDIHLAACARWRPRYATVPDLSDTKTDQTDIDRALAQVAELSAIVPIVYVVPKRADQVALLPPNIACAYSVPTSYGGAQYPPRLLAGRRVHLLGGNPMAQVLAYRELRDIAEVISLDGNAAQRAAINHRGFWSLRGVWRMVDRRLDVSYTSCWRLSCRNIQRMWQMEIMGTWQPRRMKPGPKKHIPASQLSLWPI